VGEAKRKSNLPTPESVTPLLAPIQALQSILTQFNNRGVIIGGVAVSLLGTPRNTADLDAVFLLNFEDIPIFLTEATKQGIEPRVSDPISLPRKNHILRMRHTASGIDNDISLGILPFEIEKVERGRMIAIGSIYSCQPSRFR
jgi:hypothetical protein